MNPGELDKKIIFQKFTSSIDGEGFPIEEWVYAFDRWAKMWNLLAREYYAAAVVNAETTVKFKIRYKKELDANINIEGPTTTKVFRIKYGNLFYNITSINDLDFKHEWMEIKALLEVV